jgi:hypothetical protein
MRMLVADELRQFHETKIELGSASARGCRHRVRAPDIGDQSRVGTRIPRR